MKKQWTLLPLLLNLFDGAATAGGAAEGGEGTQAGSPQAPGSGHRGKKSGGLSEVVYGKQEAPAAPPQPQEQEGSDAGSKDTDVLVTSNTLEEKKARYRDLMNGELKDVHEQEVQRILNRRFREVKATEETLAAQQPILESLFAKYGISDGDAQKLAAAIDQDDAYWQELAEKAGMGVPQYKEHLQMQREFESLKAAQRAQEGRQAAQLQIQRWEQESAQCKEAYPEFDVSVESQNPQFVALLKAGTPMKHAYEVIHLDDIKGSVARSTAAQTERNVVEGIRNKGARPAENGLNSQSGVIVKSDVSKLTKADRAEIAKRAARGENISF